MRSASGSQYDSHHTPRPIREPSSRSIALRIGVPVAGRAIHGAARSSTNESATSLRHTNDDHSGCSPARILPTNTHLASTETTSATSPAYASASPEVSAAARKPHSRWIPCISTRTLTSRRNESQTGTSRRVSHAPRAALRRRGGW